MCVWKYEMWWSRFACKTIISIYGRTLGYSFTQLQLPPSTLNYICAILTTNLNEYIDPFRYYVWWWIVENLETCRFSLISLLTNLTLEGLLKEIGKNHKGIVYIVDVL